MSYLALAAAAGRQRWGHGHAVTTKFWVGEDSDNQTHLPPKFIFSSDFGHLILKMLKIKMLMRVLFTWIVQFSFHSSVDSVCSALLVCLFTLNCRYLRSSAGNIASDQTYLFDVYLINVFITYLPRDPEPKQTERSRRSLAEPAPEYRTEQRRVKSQDHPS